MFIHVKNFLKDQTGATGVFFAIGLVLITSIVGVAIDFGRAYMIRSRMQSSLDSALLAGAQAQTGGATTAEVNTLITSTFNANWAGRSGLTPTLSINIDPTGAVTGNATLDVPATLTKLIGNHAMLARANSAVAFGAGNAEVALVLDNTGSMMGAKLQGAQDSAKALIDTLFATPGADAKVKIGLVPFTQYVNVGVGYRNQSWVSVPADGTVPYSGCVSVCRSNTWVQSGPASCFNDGQPVQMLPVPRRDRHAMLG